MYLLIEKLEISDVRLVYVPARSVGNYGGEIDNWAWPRHTGDFSFYRAYVGKDGKPADYSPDNVPFKPKHFLKVSDQGLDAERLRDDHRLPRLARPARRPRSRCTTTSSGTTRTSSRYCEAALRDRRGAPEGTAARPRSRRPSLKQSVQNGLEKFQGVLKGLTSGDLLQRKDALDKQVKAWAAQPGHEAHKAAIEKLEKMIAEEQRTARADFDRSVAFSGSQLLGTALSLTRWAEERAKQDADRKPGYPGPRSAARDRRPEAVRRSSTTARSIARTSASRWCARCSSPRAERPWLATLLGAKKGAKIDEALIDKTLDAWYARPDARGREAPPRAAREGHDGAAQGLEGSVHPGRAARVADRQGRGEEDGRADRRAPARRAVYAEAMREVLGGLLAPDANSTLRITYGTVKSFKPRLDGAGGLAVHHRRRRSSRRTPARSRSTHRRSCSSAIKAKKFGPYADPALDGELPVDFLSDLDITGGNSGSPTLNDKGELVGLTFDGTIEGVASDVVFDGATHAQDPRRRALHAVDDGPLDDADHLIKEMGLTPTL